MAKKKLQKQITIGGLTCFVEGDTEEELAADEAAARSFYARHKGNREEMNKYFEGYMAVNKLSVNIEKVVGTDFIKKSKEEK